MKKRVIAVLLSIVLTVGNAGAVPVFAAETSTAQEAVEVSEEVAAEEEAEVSEETDAIEMSETTAEEAAGVEEETVDSGEVPAEIEEAVTDETTEDVSVREAAEEIEAEPEQDFADVVETSDSESTEAEMAEDAEGTESVEVADTSDESAENEETAVVAEVEVTEAEGKEAALAGEGDVVDSGTCGENATWMLTGEGTELTLTISGSGDMKDYPAFEEPWHSKRNSITSVVVEDGITHVGRFSIYQCTNLTSIVLPEGLISIGGSAFGECINLSSIVLPESLISIGGSVFSGCKSLPNLDLPDGLTSIGDYAFSGCRCITSMDLPDGITSIEKGTFSGCANLRGINLPEGITSIGDNAFKDCSLSKVNLPENLSSIGEYAFYGCDLTSISLPEGVSIGEGAFDYCQLQSITLPEYIDTSSISTTPFKKCAISKFNIASIESWLNLNSILFLPCTRDLYLNGELLVSITVPTGITDIRDGAFYGCSNITNVILPEGVTSIGSKAFSGCSSLTSIYLPNSVTSIGEYAFQNCSGLINIVLPEGMTTIEGCTFTGCSSLESVEFSDGLTDIGTGAFGGCSSLTNVYLPESVTGIGPASFRGCSSLTSINIPDGVTSIGSDAFSECSNLTNLDLPESVTSIGSYAFENCINLTNVILPEGVNTIEGSTFKGCSRLVSVEFPEGLTSIGKYAFRDCSRLKSVEFSDGLTSIGDYAFRGCSRLKSVKLSDGLISIGEYAFYDCNSLTTINFPEGLRSIGKNAFMGGTFLESIYLPESLEPTNGQVFTGSSISSINLGSLELWLSLDSNYISFIQSVDLYLNGELLEDITIPTNITSIRDDAFRGCKKIKSVTLPEGLTAIGAFSFINCSSLTHINLPNSLTSIGTKAFSGCSNIDRIIIPHSVTAIGDAALTGIDNNNIWYYGSKEEWMAVYPDYSSLGDIVYITNPVEEIILDNAVVSVNNSINVSVQFKPADTTIKEVTWETADPEIASVKSLQNGQCTITGLQLGTTTLTAVSEEGNKTAECTITVDTPATGLTFDKNSIAMMVGESDVITAQVLPADVNVKNVHWESSDTSVISVDENGRILAIAAGKAVVTAVSENGGFTQTCSVTVYDHATGIRIEDESITIDRGTKKQLKAFVLPEETANQQVYWESSDSDIVSVDESGQINALKEGTTTISAKSEDGDFQASCTITVVVPVEEIKLNYSALEIEIEKTESLNAKVFPEDATNTNINWASSDDKIVSVNSDGVITGIQEGNAVITASSEDGRIEATCKVEVIIPVSEVQIDQKNCTIERGQAKKITATAFPENAKYKGIIWSSSNEQVAKINEKGVISAVGEGTATIKAVSSNGMTAECNVTVIIKEYKVEYVLNGGNALKKNVDKFFSGESVKLNAPERAGYVFSGWYSDAKLTNRTEGIASNQTGNKVFYAKWSPKTYKIVFNGNTSTSGKMSEFSYTIGQSVLPANVFAKKEYTFAGWNTKANGTGIAVANKGSLGTYDAANGNKITLYAQWKIKEYKIVYNLSGGTNNKSNPQTYNYKTAVKTLAKPTRKGYAFQGWFSDAKYKKAFAGIKKGSTGNKKVYAKWKKVKYTVKYVLNGGKAPKGNPTSYYVTSSSLTLKKPTKKNYTFSGWYKDSKYKNKLTKIVKGSTGNLKLYAKWEPTKYKITYNLKGGTNNKSNPATYTISTPKITLKKPTRKGYAFDGWYSDSKYKNKVTVIKKGSTGNKTFYARWKKHLYLITYELNGGRHAIGNPPSYNVTSPTIVLKDAKRTGYVFAGWYTDAGFKTKVTTIPKGSAGDIKLYAKWETVEENNLRRLYEYILTNGKDVGGKKCISKTVNSSVNTQSFIVSDGDLMFVYISEFNGVSYTGMIQYSFKERKWSAFILETVNNSFADFTAYTVIDPTTYCVNDNKGIQGYTLENVNAKTSNVSVVNETISLTIASEISFAFSNWEQLVKEELGISFTDMGFPRFNASKYD